MAESHSGLELFSYLGKDGTGGGVRVLRVRLPPSPAPHCASERPQHLMTCPVIKPSSYTMSWAPRASSVNFWKFASGEVLAYSLLASAGLSFPCKHQDCQGLWVPTKQPSPSSAMEPGDGSALLYGKQFGSTQIRFGAGSKVTAQREYQV